jgi:hypothetical protein
MIVRHRKDVQRVLITILMPIQGDGATAAINIVTNERGVVAMDALDEHDYLIDGDAVTVQRDRAREMLKEIARQTKQALAEHRIDLSVFFLVPSSGDAVITFGCSGDPDDELWSRIAAIVSAIVGRTVGLDRPRCRPVTCAATTDSVADHQHPQSPDPPSEPSPWRSAPMSTPALPHSVVDLR